MPTPNMSTLFDPLPNEAWHFCVPYRIDLSAVIGLVSRIDAIFNPLPRRILFSRRPFGCPFLYLELTDYFFSFTPERLAVVRRAVDMCEGIVGPQRNEAGRGWVRVRQGEWVRIVSTRWVGWWIEEVRKGSEMEFWNEEWEGGNEESEEKGYEAGDELEEELEAGEEGNDEQEGEVEDEDEDEGHEGEDEEDEERDEADEPREEETKDENEEEDESDIIHQEEDVDPRPSWEEAFQRRYDRMAIQARTYATEASRRQNLTNQMCRLDRHQQG